jgi:hypothetical protein
MFVLSSVMGNEAKRGKIMRQYKRFELLTAMKP